MKKYTYTVLTCIAFAILSIPQHLHAQATPKLHFCAWGDTRSMDGKITDLLDKANPELIIHSGDLWSDIYQIQQRWRRTMVHAFIRHIR